MKLINVEVDGIDMKDYPKFCDAFILYAECEDGTPLSTIELEEFENNYPEENYQYIFDSIC